MNIDTPMLAKAMIKLMLDDDYLSVMESEVASFIKSNTGTCPEAEEMATAVNYVNSLYPNKRPIIQVGIHEYPPELKKDNEPFYHSDYSAESLETLLDRME